MSPPAEFAIRFSEPGFVGRVDNSFRLAGPGQLTISAEDVVVRGTRRSTFGIVRREQELRFALAHIVNATCDQGTARFEIRMPGEPPRHLQVWTTDGADAQRICAALPSRQTDDHRARLADSHEYVRRLQAVPAGVGLSRALIAINVAVFGAMALAGAGIMSSDPQVHIRWGSNFAALTATGEWWRLATSMFLHFGLIHLVLNCWCLSAFGPLTERLYGSPRFALIYLCAGVTGSFVSMVWNPGVNSAGASGAVFGVLGALIAYVLNRANGIPPSVVMSQRNSLLAFLGYNLVFGFVHPAIDNAAHIGGLVSGAVLGLLLARPLEAQVRAQPGTGRVLLVGAGWLLLLTAGYSWVRSDPVMQEDQQFRLGLLWFGDREKESLRRYDSLTASLERRELDKVAFAQQMEAQVLPFWREAATRLAPESIHAQSRLHRLRVAMRDYVRSRLRSATLFVEGARNDDFDKVRAGAREKARGNELVTAVNAAH